MSSDSKIDEILRDLGIDDAEVLRRKAYLEFTDRDIGLLVEFHRLIEKTGECAFFVEAFYRHLQGFEETARLIRDPARLARLKQTQTEYFHTLSAGDYGMDYVRHRLGVGVAHERVGLAPKWYLGAYNKYLMLLVPKVRELYPDDEDKIQGTILALLKIIYFDMGLAIDTYIHAGRLALDAKAGQLETLNRVAVTITSSLDLGRNLEQIMRFGLTLTDARAAALVLYDTATEGFREVLVEGLSEDFARRAALGPRSAAREAFALDAAVLSNDRPDARHPLDAEARALGLRCCICLPLVSHANRLGVMLFYRDDRDAFSPDEIDTLITYASLASGAIENARLHAHVSEQAVTDALTGLPNRRYFDERLESEVGRANRYGKPLTLAMLDIDHFKRINDAYGHAAGDAVLRQVAHVLLEQIRDADFVARYGGEEFVLILPETDVSRALFVAERIRQAVAAASLRLPDGRELSVTASLGIAAFQGDNGSGDELLRHADRAMYAAKEKGRNRVESHHE